MERNDRYRAHRERLQELRRRRAARRSAARRVVDGAQRRVRLDHRPLGLRQVDAAQHRCGPDAGDVGQRLRRQARGRRARPRSRGRVPESLAAAVAQRLSERALGRGQDLRRHHDERRAPRMDAAQSRARGHGAGAQQEAGRDLRRHEAARGHRARARDETQDTAARRAVRRARRVDARASAGSGHADPRRSSATRS